MRFVGMTKKWHPSENMLLTKILYHTSLIFSQCLRIVSCNFSSARPNIGPQLDTSSMIAAHVLIRGLYAEFLIFFVIASAIAGFRSIFGSVSTCTRRRLREYA